MSIWSRLFGREEKASAAASVVAGWAPGYPQSPKADFKGLNEEGYAKCMAVYSCVNKIADSVAHIPLCLYRGDAEVEDHPLMKRLQRPNAWTPGYLFWKSFVSFRLLNGNAYLERVLRSGAPAKADPTELEGDSINTPQEDPILELWFHRPDWMKIQIGKFATPEAYVLENAGKKKSWPSNPTSGESDILHWRSFNPTDPWFGQSPLKTGIDAMRTFNKANEWNNHMLDNAAQPNGAFVYKPTDSQPGGMSQIQMDAIAKALEEKMSGPKNARRPLILNNLEWQTMSLTPLEMDWLNGKDSSIRDICNIFGVPPQMLGLKDAQTYANYAEARQSFYMETVLPMLDELCDVLNHWLTPAYGEDLKLKPDHDDVDALNPSRYEKWEKVNANNTLTVNEKRDAIGYEETEDGDVILVPSTNIPLGDVVNPPEPVLPPGAFPPGTPGADGVDAAASDATKKPEGAPGAKPPFPPKKPAAGLPFGKKSRLVRLIEKSLAP
jgi:HK97 family phage portal protein